MTEFFPGLHRGQSSKRPFLVVCTDPDHDHEKLIARNPKNLRDVKIVSRKFSSILQHLSNLYDITPNEFGLIKNLDKHLNSPTWEYISIIFLVTSLTHWYKIQSLIMSSVSSRKSHT